MASNVRNKKNTNKNKNESARVSNVPHFDKNKNNFPSTKVN